MITPTSIERPRVLRLWVAKNEAGPTNSLLLICTGAAFFDFRSNDDSDSRRDDELEFLIQDTDGSNLVIDVAPDRFHATVIVSIDEFEGDDVDNGLWAIANPDAHTRNQNVELTADVSVRGGSNNAHVKRVAYQVTILVDPAPPTLISLTLDPARVRRGDTSLGTVTLSGPAPRGGDLVNLVSANPGLAIVPASVTVVEGQITATFGASTQPVVNQPSQVDRSVDISASLAGVTKTATLTVVGEIS